VIEQGGTERRFDHTDHARFCVAASGRFTQTPGEVGQPD
jgi:hypothetical protein